MKTEWLTVKGSFLYAGGHGVEYRDKNGSVVNEDQMWIKVISKTGEVRSVNWKDVYTKVRDFAGFPAPGYLTHEAVHWSEVHKKWFFLPRKASTTMYDEKADQTKGTNLLITADENFKSFEIVKVGVNNHPERGFSAFVFVPGTKDSIIVALKSKEVDGEDPESFVTVFDIRGNIIMADQKLGGSYKFEGIFLTKRPEPTSTVSSSSSSVSTKGTTSTAAPTRRPWPKPNCGNPRLTNGLRNLFLHMHNRFRSNLAKGQTERSNGWGIAPPATLMYRMKYSCAAESFAQQHAGSCVARHLPQHAMPGYKENIHILRNVQTTREGAIQNALTSWWSELARFGMRSNMMFYNSEFQRGNRNVLSWSKCQLVLTHIQIVRVQYGEIARK
ncbi:hypothetical protein Y032_0799g2411 [Ancylostoma ceylanicum]|uniref:SCP domain-containing protein n=1 Tax=Ancylostoma ceylanicum TaxID=53326 RepID=A0A016WCJ6_9BILA|nr:hypothetical protein Y032_0799g2411 [Ancylostoma ceylanicum]